MNYSFPGLSIIVFSIIMTAGGIAGYVKAKSKASLIAGLFSMAAMMFCYWLSLSKPKQGYELAFILIGPLVFVFINRLVRTKKVMPSGALLILCLLEQLILYLNAMNVG